MSNKVYFDSEEECKDFFDKNIETCNDDHDDLVVIAVLNCIKKCHIKKSDLEIVREEYTKYYKNAEYSTDEVLIKAIYYIELLEKALEAR